MRIGIGYDIHRLAPGRPLVLGGVTIPYERGLLGHSDADVLTHAFCDALLGAAALGDIGLYFPDDDPAYHNICSLELLAEVYKKVQANGYRLNNMDATVFAEAPKLAPYRREIELRLAACLNVDYRRISVKATTTEGLGEIGQGAGIAAMCIVAIASSDASLTA